MFTEQASLHAALDATGAVIRAHDHASSVCVTDSAGGMYLVTIAGALMAVHLAGVRLAQAMVTGAAASLAVEGIGSNWLFTATPCEMQRRDAVVTAMAETACRHG